jgi:hypothetical protein
VAEIKEVADLGDDRIRVTVLRDDGSEVKGEGWLSAISNHYDLDSYGPDGHLRPDATPRRMTRDEVTDYLLGLVASPQPQILSVELTGIPKE